MSTDGGQIQVIVKNIATTPWRCDSFSPVSERVCAAQVTTDCAREDTDAVQCSVVQYSAGSAVNIELTGWILRLIYFAVGFLTSRSISSPREESPVDLPLLSRCIFFMSMFLSPTEAT
jgi:hypothetical protein